MRFDVARYGARLQHTAGEQQSDGDENCAVNGDAGWAATRVGSKLVAVHVQRGYQKQHEQKTYRKDTAARAAELAREIHAGI